jgi:hypothetical protein
MAIGEADANIVACPACARPLDAGASKCPSCGTRMIAGVRAGRALGFVASGLLVGLIVGTSVTGAVAIATRPVVDSGTPTTPAASTAPGASVAPVASAVPVGVPTIPTAAVSAIRQSSVLNQRLADDAARLATALAARPISTAELAKVLRSLSASAQQGERLAPQVARWSSAAGLSVTLQTMYAEVGTTARDGLAASLRNDAAYRDASRRMLTVLAVLGAVETETRPLAAEAGLDLPALVLP